MKKIKFLQIIALCLTLSSCESCEEKEWDTLPPETQIGANTFGCYVNGELFVKKKGEFGFMVSPPLSAYYDSNQVLSINCGGRDEMGEICLRVRNPVEGIKQATLWATLTKIVNTEDNKTYIVTYNMVANTGEIVLTKLDIVNRIVSGRFQFQGRYSGTLGDSIVFVTNGRFDTKTFYIE